MNLLLPQNRPCVVRRVARVDLHGDRYVDLALELDGPGGEVVPGRLSEADCPGGLAEGDRVVARFTMGVLIRIDPAT